MNDFDWRQAERALVAIGQPTVGIGVVILGGIIIADVRTVPIAGRDSDASRFTVRVTAGDDRRWRGAMAGMLAIENGTAVLGHSGLDADAREALDQLLYERLAVDVADLHDAGEIMLSVPMPNGSWLRLPALACGDRILTIHATPLAGCEVIFDMLDGMPAFTEPGQLAGFVRVFRSPRGGQLAALVVRADAALTGLSRASCASSGAP